MSIDYTDVCVSCGADCPEGSMICSGCQKALKKKKQTPDFGITELHSLISKQNNIGKSSNKQKDGTNNE